jgi:hypothetical protein
MTLARSNDLMALDIDGYTPIEQLYQSDRTLV